MEGLELKKDEVQKAMCLYLVTDQRWVKKSLFDDVENALKGGVTCVQLREKKLENKAFVEEAIKMKRLCQKYHVPLIINDNVDVLLESDADGIHVGQSDMNAQDVRKRIGSDKILGVSVQTVQQAMKAQQDGADYLGVGAVFSTKTKKNAMEVDFTTLKTICDIVDIPIVAIGGIDEKNMTDLKGTHIDGIAVVSAIMAQDDIEKATCLLKQKATLI